MQVKAALDTCAVFRRKKNREMFAVSDFHGCSRVFFCTNNVLC